ncbi:hypothetical protein ABMA32_02420 [Mesorhizobium sp. VNQ89]|uniref:hypothetical protein n=1 Tax=Mesorhizobium quangtriensis TaxID=3157709 RepID=UPI0032B71719
MKHNGIADPDQLVMLAKVLEIYCTQAGILANSPEREQIAATIIALYERGISDEEQLIASLPARNSMGNGSDGKRAQPAVGSDVANVTSTKTAIDRR